MLRLTENEVPLDDVVVSSFELRENFPLENPVLEPY